MKVDAFFELRIINRIVESKSESYPEIQSEGHFESHSKSCNMVRKSQLRYKVT